jgi:hypothetical protein
MFRLSALLESGGYDPSVIAGEEPELCVRLRLKDWKIRRLDAEMTLHDAAMTRFGQWWKRNVRAGHAYAEGRARHGGGPTRHWVREVRSILFWALFVPLAALAAAWPTRGLSLLVGLAYPLLAWRIRRHEQARGRSPGDAGLYAWYTVLGKFPQLAGALRYWTGRLSGRRSRIIEYKGAAPAAAVEEAGVRIPK